MTGRVLFVLVLGAGWVSACGESSDTETVQEFQREAQRLCREAVDQVAPSPNAADPRALARSLRGALAVSGRFVQRFETLDAPARLERAKREAIQLEHRDDAVWRRVVARLERGVAVRRAFAPDADLLARNRAQGDALYRKLGMSACTSEALDNGSS